MNFLYGTQDNDSIPWLAETLVGINYGAVNDDVDRRLNAVREAKDILLKYNNMPAAYRTFHEGSVVYNLLSALKEFISYQDANVLKDILDAIHYFIDVGEEERQILVDKGIIKAAFKHLDHADPNVILAALGVVSAFIRGSSSEEEKEMIKEWGGFDKIKKHQSHANKKVVTVANALMSYLSAKLK